MARIKFRRIRRDQVLGDEEANALFDNDRALDEAIDALIDSAGEAAGGVADQAGQLAAHLAATNPHGVTAAQVGAAAAADLAAHLAATNPHGITPAGIGAATAEQLAALEARVALHLGDATNPHDTTAAQVGAPTADDLAAHIANAIDPHPGFAGGGTAADPELLEADGSATLAIGDLVAVDRSLGTGAVVLADPTDEDRMPAIAIVVGRADVRVVLRFGGRAELPGLAPGRPYFVGRYGRPTLAPPMPGAGEAVFQQHAGVALSPSSFRVALSPELFRARG